MRQQPLTPFNQSRESALETLSNLKQAMDASVIFAVTDANGIIIDVNDMFCSISQYSRQELLGQDHRIINSGLHPKTFFKELWATITQGQIWRGEIRNRAKDGSFYWVDTTIVPFLDAESQKPYQYIAVRNDITYMKKVEEALRLLNDQLELKVQERTMALEKAYQENLVALNRLREEESMRETFISALTHDMRTPLVAEHRAFELLKAHHEPLPEKLQGLIDRLIINNEDLLSMVNKFLEIYQYEAGRLQLYIETVSIGDVIIHCLEKLQPLADAKSIVLRAELPQETVHIEGDSDQLVRLLTNLLGNAIQHNPAGSEVVVRIGLVGQQVEILVSDNGPGIDPDKLPHLFDRYFSMGQSRKKIGSGLGLSICRMIVKLHQGSIQVISNPSKGTTFKVILPLHQHLGSAAAELNDKEPL